MCVYYAACEFSLDIGHLTMSRGWEGEPAKGRRGREGEGVPVSRR